MISRGPRFATRGDDAIARLSPVHLAATRRRDDETLPIEAHIRLKG